MSGTTGAPGSGPGQAAYAPAQGAGPGGEQQQPPPQPHHPPQAYQPPVAGPAQQASAGYGPGQGYGQAAQAPGEPMAQRRPRPAARPVPHTRSARLRVAKADPWSVMKVSFLLSIALGICTVVAVAVLWLVLDAIGVFGTVGSTLSEATGAGTDGGFDLASFLSLPRVLLFTSVIAVIDVVLATALATLGAFVYNLSSGFVGGVELTLAEDE